MSDLCWKCREYPYGETTSVDRDSPWVHCHHEPKEKAKCFCEYERVTRTDMVSAQEKVGDKIVEHFRRVNFCPQCGRCLKKIIMTDLGYDDKAGCFKTKFDYGDGRISVSEYFGPAVNEYRQTHDYAHLVSKGVSQEEIEALGLIKKQPLHCPEDLRGPI